MNVIAKVKVRVAVIVNNNGHYNAVGWNAATDKLLKQTVVDGLDESCDNEQLYFLTVELPIPRSIEIEVTEKDIVEA